MSGPSPEQSLGDRLHALVGEPPRPITVRQIAQRRRRLQRMRMVLASVATATVVAGVAGVLAVVLAEPAAYHPPGLATTPSLTASSATPSPTQSPTTVALPDCQPSDFVLRQVGLGGAGGSYYQTLEIVPMRRTRCAFRRFSVAYVDSSGHRLGPASRRPGRISDQVRGRAVSSLQLRDGGPLYLWDSIASPGSFGSGGCAQQPASRVVITLNTARLSLPTTLSVCTNGAAAPLLSRILPRGRFHRPFLTATRYPPLPTCSVSQLTASVSMGAVGAGSVWYRIRIQDTGADCALPGRPTSLIGVTRSGQLKPLTTSPLPMGDTRAMTTGRPADLTATQDAEVVLVTGNACSRGQRHFDHPAAGYTYRSLRLGIGNQQLPVANGNAPEGPIRDIPLPCGISMSRFFAAFP